MEGKIITLAAVLAVIGFSGSLCAQPAAFTHRVERLELVEPIVPEPIDLAAVLAEDEQQDPYGGPYRFGIARSVDVTPQTDGVWEEIDEETLLWRLPIASPGAVCLSLGFTRYFMPPGGKLYIYTTDESQVRGPFTETDNAEHGELWTPLLNSDAIVVELTIPVLEVPQLELELTSVNHGYRGFETEWTLLALGDSLPCNINVACPQGNSWRDQIRSVAWYHMVSEGYQLWCSGSLVNNTAADGTPYFLTAFHCFDPIRDRLIEDPYGAARTMVVYWNYESSTCGGTWASDSQNQSGATFRAAYWASDFALVELGSKPPASYNVYYAGWDRRDVVPSSGAAIHHPQHDLKKVSIENDPLSKIRLIPPGVDYGIHFMVNEWDAGLTEHASSGGPFFNSDKRIVGQLFGSPGESTCANVQPNYFGPLYRSWDEGTKPDRRLSDWLDRGNTGVTFVDGKNPVGTTVLTFEGITTDEIAYISDGYGGLSWSGSFCVYRPPAGANNGYVNGRISPDYVAYNGDGNPVEMSGSSFDFVGAYLTAAHQERLDIMIEGYRSGLRVYSRTVIVNRQSPTWIWLGYEAVDRVTFRPTPHTGPGYQFVMDDMVIERSLIPGTATVYASSDVPKDIWDNMSVFSTLVIADTGRIADIDVRLNITHTYCEDLSVYLRPPPGLGVYRIKLFSSIGNAHNNFSNTILDDEAPKAITQGAAPFTGSYRPVGRLSALYGGSITGTWKLEISDEARWDQGMLNSWSLIIEK